MKKSLLISGNTAFESIFKYTRIDNADLLYAYYGSSSILLSAIRILWMKLSLPFKHIWYRKIDFSLYEKIIIMDTFIDVDYISYVSSIAPSVTPKHFYFWNIYNDSKIKKKDIEKYGFKTWSFDHEDCIKYGFSYNPQFYAKSWYEGFMKKSDVDVSFVGRDKSNRMQRIDELVDIFKSQGVSVRTYITADKWYRRFASMRYRSYLDFKQVIMEECKGKAVLELGQKNQSGSTLRLYDGLMNHRKVITNIENVTESRLYSQNNVFVLGKDDIHSLKGFIDSPFVEICHEDEEFYCAEKWIERF